MWVSSGVVASKGGRGQERRTIVVAASATSTAAVPTTTVPTAHVRASRLRVAPCLRRLAAVRRLRTRVVGRPALLVGLAVELLALALGAVALRPLLLDLLLALFDGERRTLGLGEELGL